MKKPEAQKTAAEKEEERRQIEQCKAAILQKINGALPVSHSSWSYQKAVDFKKCAKRARSVAEMKTASLVKVRQTYAELVCFYN